jgi:RNA polymerase sigma-70 factor (ECF subfamily)
MWEMESAVSQSKLTQSSLVRLLVSERVKMLAFIQSLVRDEHMAEDIFQELCMLAVEKAESIRDDGHLLRWMRVSARFLSLNALQAHDQRNLSLDDRLIEILEPAWQRRDRDNMSDRADALRECVGQLPKRGRALIEKRYTQGQSYESLATETGRPVPSLYVTFSRIFARLSVCINSRLRAIQGANSG